MKILSLLMMILISACSKTEEVRTGNFSVSPFESSQYYFKSSKRIVMDVIYESGHPPYTLTNLQSNPLWQITEENLVALFLGRSTLPEIVVPKRLEDMREISVQNKSSWTVQGILGLAQEHRIGQSSETVSHFVVLFLGGYFNDGSKDYPTTVGVSLGGTTIIAIFKDVVKSTESLSNPLVSRYVEQATVIHEMGHALGLVDNGLPMKDAHKDAEHGPHCNNPDCVMYWLNEGKENLQQFMVRFIQSGNMILFDDKCLRDSREY
jgi:hypothetical protein